MGTRPVIAIDLGGTTVKAALVDKTQVLVADAIPAHSSLGLGRLLPRLADLVHGLCARVGLTSADCAGIGMAVPFLVDPGHCRITSVPKEKFADASAIDLRQWSLDTFGLELRMENDAHAAALGEWRHGAGLGVDNLVMFTLGTGIGCSVILGGRPLRGKRFQAGVLFGHIIADPDGEPCVCCPANGCYEALAASRSLQGQASRDPGFAQSALSREEEIDFKSLFIHAAAGDRLALAIRDRVVRYWSALAVSACSAYDPDRIIIGGAVVKDADAFLPAMQAYVNRHAWSVQPPQIVPAVLGNQAGTIGIATLFSETPTCI